jgi:hypothetical protein
VSHTVLTAAGVDRQRVLTDIDRLLRTGHDVFGDSDLAALESIGIDLNAVRAKIEETFGPGALQPPPPARKRGFLSRWRPENTSPFTPRAKKVLELSLREALHLGHGYIGTEHLLLGLLREGNGLAAKILSDEGVDLADLRRRTLAAIEQAA